MWQLENTTPFAAERTFVRDRDGSEVWLVAVKATYTIRPDGSTELANDQAPVCVASEYRGEPGNSSLRYESDLVPTKPYTDVILHGHAQRPDGHPTRSLDVAFKVGRIEKTLRVFGERYWEQGVGGLQLLAPEPFERMPIVYERAFGGVDERASSPKQPCLDPRNPVGRGFAMAPKHLLGKPAPNLEYPGDPIKSWRQRPHPAGFGPVSPHWSPRLELTGTYDRKWQEERQPLLPLDFDDRHYQCAPLDQQSQRHLRGGEPVALYNLSPRGTIKFSLPRVYLAFVTHFADEAVQHLATLHTVILEPDFPRVILVWHTSLRCHNKGEKLEKTVIVEKEQK